MNVRSALAWSPGAAGPLFSEAEPDWRDAALCATADPDAWFPEDGMHGVEAKAICRRCPVRLECLEDALARDEQWGIFGGLSALERRRLKRQRSLGEAA